MNRKIKTAMSFLLAAVMVLSVIPFAGLYGFIANADQFKIIELTKGDLISFGMYPQSQVNDTDLENKLKKAANLKSDETPSVSKGWISYEYYSGTDYPFNGLMKQDDYMLYKDVYFDGSKYRGVYFSEYRPIFTHNMRSSTNSYQDEHGFKEKSIYWFKYEPVKWRVLDPKKGLVISEIVIDSQPFNNYSLLCSKRFYGDNILSYYANNYEKSSVREWLNRDFYNTAFSEEEQNIINYTKIDNKAYDVKYSEYDSSATKEKLFLLSYEEVITSSSNFADSSARMALSSDYSRVQGLSLTSSKYKPWLLRSAGTGDYCVVEINSTGWSDADRDTNCTAEGIRPAFCFNLNKYIIESETEKNGTVGKDGRGEYRTDISEYSRGDIALFGYYPQAEVKNPELIKELNGFINGIPAVLNGWTSYGYYSGNDKNDGQMKPEDYMIYKDVIYKGIKYRGVFIDRYFRQNYTLTSVYFGTSTYQKINGYDMLTTYWFKYEPIKWRVLDSKTGFVMSESILDAQAYNNIIFNYNGKDWGDAEATHYANNYGQSSIRQWLNTDFYNLAFSEKMQNNNIRSITHDEGFYVSDKIFLLSSEKANSKNYFSSDTDRKASGTDYAKAQGLKVVDSYSSWWLSTPNPKYEFNSFSVSYMGSTAENMELVCLTSYGVRPVLALTPGRIIYRPEISENGTTGKDGRREYAESVSVNKSNISLAIGETEELYASKSPSNTTDGVSWKSSDPSVAAVDYKGKVTAVKPGTATITAFADHSGKSDNCIVTVVEKTATDIKLDKSSVSIIFNKTDTLTATVTPSDSTDKIIWKSSDTSVATVDSSGNIFAVKIGSATITATTTSGKEAVCIVKVIRPAYSVAFDKSTLTLAEGGSEKLNVILVPSDSTDKLSWSSSDPSVADVDNNGKITAKKAGTASITATALQSGQTAVCKVTVITSGKIEKASYVLGDADLNKKINVDDARLALRAAVKLEKLNELQTLAADVDGSGLITVDDARDILRAAVKLISPTDFKAAKK